MLCLGGIKCIFRKQLYTEKSTSSGFTVWDVAVFHRNNMPKRKYGLFWASENYSHCCIMGSFHYWVTPIVKFKIFKSPRRKHELWMSASMEKMCINLGHIRSTYVWVWTHVWMQIPSVCTKAFAYADFPLNHSPSCSEDASYFSRHVPIYHLLSSQACFLMIRIIYTSFTFIDLLLFLVPKTFLKILCLPTLPLPPLPFPPPSYKNVTYDSLFPLPVSSSTFPLPCESHCL